MLPQKQTSDVIQNNNFPDPKTTLRRDRYGFPRVIKILPLDASYVGTQAAKFTNAYMAPKYATTGVACPVTDQYAPVIMAC
ncbi:MAG TPA: hypothetical protein VGT05_02755 [Patescibacteria group bacterium]|nr:hypothetical protein [Patescibacteria group bacterium]